MPALAQEKRVDAGLGESGFQCHQSYGFCNQITDPAKLCVERCKG